MNEAQNTKITGEELHLIILWERARGREREILADIANHLKILECKEIAWTKAQVANNFTRFYGVKLDSGSFKEIECGTGSFLLILVKDEKPVYDFMQTSRGIESVNQKLFTLKEKYRKWTGGGHKIHATNSPTETNHDIVLLLGCNYYDYLKNAPKEWDGRIERIQRDLTGCEQWKSLEELLYTLNATTEYLVLRNYDILPGAFRSELHGDIDILTKDYQEICYLANAHAVFPEAYRVHNYVLINNHKVLFDFRSVGDDYYCRAFEKDMLGCRVMNEQGIYVPSTEYAFHSLVYHALYHKPEIAKDYYAKTLSLFEGLGLDKKYDLSRYSNPFLLYNKLLKEFMSKNEYSYTRPKDLSVFFKPEYLEKRKRETEDQAREMAQVSSATQKSDREAGEKRQDYEYEKKQTDKGYVIDKVQVDMSKYKGNDGFSEGEVENELLKIVRSGVEEAALRRDSRWPILHHLSSVRENLLSWLPLKGTERVLEVGSGCGALTGLLCSLAAYVEAVELSSRRAEISAWRNHACENLTIHVGNLHAMEFSEKFDCIVLIGVLEYAGAFTKAEHPFRTFLAACGRWLKMGGKMVVAIENRLGMKYWSGAVDDHTGKIFDGLMGYPDYKGIRTFSHQELEKILTEAGFHWQKWFYPFPDYKMPLEIHSDSYLPKDSQLLCHINTAYDRDRYEFFPETQALLSVAKAGLYHEFANSFMVVCSKEKVEDGWGNMPQYVHFTDVRERPYRIMTAMHEVSGKPVIRKYALNEESVYHLHNIAENIRHLAKVYGKEHLPWIEQISDSVLEMEYIEGQTLTEVMLSALKKEGGKGLEKWLQFYLDHILRGEGTHTKIHRKMDFGQQGRNYDVDVNFDNICLIDDKFVLFDCEWLLPHVGRKFVLYRVLDHFWRNHSKDLQEYHITLESLFKAVGINANELELFLRDDQQLFAHVMNFEIMRYWKKRMTVNFK